MERVESAATPPKETGGKELVSCPWCGSDRVERMSDYGSHLMVAQYLCLKCHSPFELIRR
jgi:DNA-directed RNA polymerase subunit RPC12/RpoP